MSKALDQGKIDFSNAKGCYYGMDAPGCLGIQSTNTKDDQQNLPHMDNFVCQSKNKGALGVVKCPKGATVFPDTISDLTAATCCLHD